MGVEIQFKLHEQRGLSPQQQNNVQHIARIQYVKYKE